MKKELTKKKALLIIKLSITIAVALLVALFCVIIAQTVKINRLEAEINEAKTSYNSEIQE